ncbi:major capsid protein [Hartmannibacter diazotrophicus]|nr:major capsid protein [Hartmannibacter diazotrophicus]
MDPLPSWVLDTFFTGRYYSEDFEIKFGDLPEADRFLAPFVLPYEQGKPIAYAKGEDISAFTPPYIKLKDRVRAVDAKNLKPSEIFRNRGAKPSLEERFNQRVVEVSGIHLRAIDVRRIWMACRAFFDGKVLIQYERDQGAANPDVLLDFGRAAGHTVVKSADYWNDPSTDIMGDVETWSNTMYLARGGGAPTMMIVGAQVAPLFRKNTGVKAALDTNYRGNNSVQMDLGIMNIERPLQYVGRLSTTLEVWTYKDTIDIPDGSGGKTKIDLFNEKDICLVAPGATGVLAHGAIYDADAMMEGMVSTDVYAKMWMTKDPGDVMLMHQSSPLPIPLYPNRTFKARVLA